MLCFAVLGLADSATVDEVKAAFRSKGLSLHPDMGGNAYAFDELRQHYTEALRLATDRPCATCNGTGRITKTVGWNSIELACTDCN